MDKPFQFSLMALLAAAVAISALLFIHFRVRESVVWAIDGTMLTVTMSLWFRHLVRRKGAESRGFATKYASPRSNYAPLLEVILLIALGTLILIVFAFVDKEPFFKR